MGTEIKKYGETVLFEIDGDELKKMSPKDEARLKQMIDCAANTAMRNLVDARENRGLPVHGSWRMMVEKLIYGH